jgi:hypothetical protein
VKRKLFCAGDRSIFADAMHCFDHSPGFLAETPDHSVEPETVSDH